MGLLLNILLLKILPNINVNYFFLGKKRHFYLFFYLGRKSIFFYILMIHPYCYKKMEDIYHNKNHLYHYLNNIPFWKLSKLSLLFYYHQILFQELFLIYLLKKRLQFFYLTKFSLLK